MSLASETVNNQALDDLIQSSLESEFKLTWIPREEIVDILRLEGFEVRDAENGRLGLALARLHVVHDAVELALAEGHGHENVRHRANGPPHPALSPVGGEGCSRA